MTINASTQRQHPAGRTASRPTLSREAANRSELPQVTSRPFTRHSGPAPALAILTVVLPALAVLCAGCGGGKIPPSHYYSLVLPPPAEGTAAPGVTDLPRIELGIPAFHVDPPFDQERIVHRGERDGLEVGFYAGALWAAPLSRQLPALVGDHLMRIAGGFVSAGPPGGRPLDARLEGRLMALEQIDVAGAPVARFRMSLTLRSPGGDAVWSDVLSGEAPLGGSGMGETVRSMRAAMVEALDGARPALVGALIGLARSKEGF